MKKWVEKLIEQFDFDWNDHRKNGEAKKPAMSEERATLLFIIDTFNKHLMEIEGHPVRKVRETLDEFAKELIQSDERRLERTFFRLRQFFATYRLDETSYFLKTFEDFRAIIWDFIDQLSEDIDEEKKEDFEIRQSLQELKEAVESNSIDVLKQQSRRFIDIYVEKQFRKDKRRSSRMRSIRNNLKKVKQQLGEAQDKMSKDHLTQAFNRKSFDEFCQNQWKLFHTSETPVTMMLLDIDHFKRINDTFGHQIGDFVLKELVVTLKDLFSQGGDFIARIGGEEFAIILPDHTIEQARVRAEHLLERIRKEVYVHEEHQLRFTISIGIAQLCPGEDVSAWVKRADMALYSSKSNGRNRYTLAAPALTNVA